MRLGSVDLPVNYAIVDVYPVERRPNGTTSPLGDTLALLFLHGVSMLSLQFASRPPICITTKYLVPDGTDVPNLDSG